MGQARSGRVLMSFNRGEVSPDMDARVDLEGAAAMCRRLRNMTVDVAGGASRRRGFQFVAQTKVAGGAEDTLFEPSGLDDVVGIFPTDDGRVLVCEAPSLDGSPGEAQIAFRMLFTDGSPDTVWGAVGGELPQPVFFLPSATLDSGNRVTLFDGSTFTYVRYDSDGQVDAGFAGVVPSDFCLGAALQADGKVLLCGQFLFIDATPRQSIARINTNGTLDAGFDVLFDDPGHVAINAIELASGKILVLGIFDGIGGEPCAMIARLNTDGTADAAFDTGTVFDDNDPPMVAIELTDQSLIIGGYFAAIGGSARNRIAKFSSSGVLDASFNPNANGAVHFLGLQGDGKIVVGGEFTVIAGASRSYLARLNTDGSIDSSFNPTIDAPVRCGALSGGFIYFGGLFTIVNSTPRSKAARLNPDGTLA